MEEITFNRSPSPTIGVELEIQILDRKTLGLKPLAPEILSEVPPALKERIKPEFIRSMVEINTAICSDVSEVEKDLNASYKWLEETAHGMDASLFAVSLHPFSGYRDQQLSDHPRYKKIMNELQLIGRRFITQGLHVHIGVSDEETVIRVNNNLRIYLPILLALTTSSPFYGAEDTGLMSYRAKLFEALPLAGMPDSLNDWEDFDNLIGLLRKSGIIETVKDIWWDVRPHPDFGTVEIRICDLPYTMRDILALTALIQALVVTLCEQHLNPDPNIQVLRSNRWQAARHGLDGLFVDPFFGKKISMIDAVRNLYKYVRPASEGLKSTGYLDEIPEILNRLTGTHKQRELYYNGNRDFTHVIKTVQGLFHS